MDYQLIRSNRKTVAIQIKPDGQLIVRAPWRMSDAQINRFVEDKHHWIQTHLPKRVAPPEKYSDEEIHALTRQAMEVIPERVAHYATILGVTYGRITIRNQRTRWGSCSVKGNLNFNCLLMLLPADVVDYVVVHELCHRKEMNHSARFWAVVEKILPNYRAQRQYLKEHGGTLISRLG